jgi:hypothetical protein
MSETSAYVVHVVAANESVFLLAFLLICTTHLF